MRARHLLPSFVLLLAGCDQLGGPTHGPPANVVAHAGNGAEGVAGEVVTPAPAVRVTDAEDRAVPGAEVTFTVTGGGGSVSGATRSTDDDGIASVSAWQLGTVAGENTLEASVEGLDPVDFTVTGVAGPATGIVKLTADALEWNIGTAVTPAPRVVVRDQHDNPVAGASVTFAVASGGGSATGTSQVTSASGEATVGGWTLGSAPGTNTLTATAGSLPAATFTMTGVDMCGRAPDHALATTTNGTLTTGDCLLASGFNVDKYTMQRGGTTAFRLDLTSSEIDTRLMLFAHPDVALVSSSSSTMNASMPIIAAPGNPLVGASSTVTGASGAYAMASSSMAESMTNCVAGILAGELTTSQSIQSSDCVDDGGAETYYLDVFVFFAQAGRTYTVTHTTSAFDPYMELQTLSGVFTHAAFSTGSGELSADITFTPSNSSYRLILASTVGNQETGSYTLSVSSTAGAPAGAEPVPVRRLRVTGPVARRAVAGLTAVRRH